MYTYLTKNNKFRYLDVINKLITGYNNSVHSTIVMPPKKVNSPNISQYGERRIAWGLMFVTVVLNFKVGYLVRITKEKAKFTKVYEQTFSTDIFKVV